jgi:hypothetical protein
VIEKNIVGGNIEITRRIFRRFWKTYLPPPIVKAQQMQGQQKPQQEENMTNQFLVEMLQKMDSELKKIKEVLNIH